MAQVTWQKRAERELYRYLVKGFQEFGETTANRFADRVGYINGELKKFPEMGAPGSAAEESEETLSRLSHQSPF